MNKRDKDSIKIKKSSAATHNLSFQWGDVLLAPLMILVLSICLFFWHPLAGLFGLLCAFYVLYLNYSKEKEIISRTKRAVEQLNQEFDEVTKNAVFGMPFPMAVISDEGQFLWYNSHFKLLFQLEHSYLGESCFSLFPEFEKAKYADKEKKELDIEREGKIFSFHYNHTKLPTGERLVLLYGVDRTDDERVRALWQEERLVIWNILFDNYDEVHGKLETGDRPLLLARVDQMLNAYAAQYDAFLLKYENDHYAMVTTRAALCRAEEEHFTLLESMHEIEVANDRTPTLSIGIAIGEPNPAELQKEARAAIDIALSRGGDQVVIKEGEKLRYFGGKNQATERYTRVKARVMANTILKFVEEASNVLIMGHRNPDMDSFGSCLGMLNFVEQKKKKGYIVLDRVTPAIENLYNKAVEEWSELGDLILTPEEAPSYLEKGSLILVMDNHRRESTACSDLLDDLHRIVIVDHHRRGGDYIRNAAVSYIEPSASSASELVTEILSYGLDELRLRRVVAEGLLAGITVDTKNFFYQTGVRTFEAAAVLKRQGADSIVIKQLFKDDFEFVRYRSEIIATAKHYAHATMIGRFQGGMEGATLVAAQAADDLLEIRGVEASFVLTRNQERTHISARSLGKVSVQLIMESLGGGGHLTASATQLDMDIDAAEIALKKAIDAYFEEEEHESTADERR